MGAVLLDGEDACHICSSNYKRSEVSVLKQFSEKPQVAFLNIRVANSLPDGGRYLFSNINSMITHKPSNIKIYDMIFVEVLFVTIVQSNLVSVKQLNQYYDVKVKRYPMALSLVKLHKQPKGLGERPVLGRCFLAALVPLPARVERERAQGVCAA